MPNCTVRLAHYLSYTPLCELSVDAETATFGELKLQLFQHLLAQEASPARVFTRFFVQVTGTSSEKHEITDIDDGSLLTSVGIVDESFVLCEGPDTTNVDGIGMALSALTAEGQSSKLLTASQLASIRSSIQELVEENAALKQEKATVEAQLSAKIQNAVDLLMSDVCTLRCQADDTKSSLQRDIFSLRHRCDYIDVTCSRLDGKPVFRHVIPDFDGNCYECGRYGHRAAECHLHHSDED